jgi:hypothetical protein
MKKILITVTFILLIRTGYSQISDHINFFDSLVKSIDEIEKTSSSIKTIITKGKNSDDLSLPDLSNRYIIDTTSKVLHKVITKEFRYGTTVPINYYFYNGKLIKVVEHISPNPIEYYPQIGDGVQRVYTLHGRGLIDITSETLDDLNKQVSKFVDNYKLFPVYAK